jgi:uncharacterized membrane protein YwzB
VVLVLLAAAAAVGTFAFKYLKDIEDNEFHKEVREAREWRVFLVQEQSFGIHAIDFNPMHATVVSHFVCCSALLDHLYWSLQSIQTAPSLVVLSHGLLHS